MNMLPWIAAARPRTLTLSVTPVIVGTALAWEERLRWPAVVAALVGSMFIQLGTNLPAAIEAGLAIGSLTAAVLLEPLAK